MEVITVMAPQKMSRDMEELAEDVTLLLEPPLKPTKQNNILCYQYGWAAFPPLLVASCLV
jgi:hypothetical protein